MPYLPHVEGCGHPVLMGAHGRGCRARGGECVCAWSVISMPPGWSRTSSSAQARGRIAGPKDPRGPQDEPCSICVPRETPLRTVPGCAVEPPIGRRETRGYLCRRPRSVVPWDAAAGRGRSAAAGAVLGRSVVQGAALSSSLGSGAALGCLDDPRRCPRTRCAYASTHGLVRVHTCPVRWSVVAVIGPSSHRAVCVTRRRCCCRQCSARGR